MVIGDRIFEDNNKTYIMGILNVTPDSFYDGGKYDTVDNALFRTEEIINSVNYFFDKTIMLLQFPVLIVSINEKGKPP